MRTDSHRNRPASAPADHRPGVEPRRRRALKGALGALPVLYTLPSGAQTAFASACTAQAAARQQPQFGSAMYGSSTRLNPLMQDRVGSARVATGTVGNRTAYCIMETQIPGRLAAPRQVCDSGFGSSWVYEDGSQAPSSLVARTGAGEFTIVRGDAYGLVYVDESGRLRPFRTSPGGSVTANQGAAGSACMSINPMAG